VVASIRNVLSKKVNINGVYLKGKIWKLAILLLDSDSEVGDSIIGGIQSKPSVVRVKKD